MSNDLSLQDGLWALQFHPTPNIIPVEGIGKEIRLKNGNVRHTGKQPGTHAHLITWKQFQNRMITRDEYKQLFQYDDPFDAVGIISGVNGWRCFDFDQCCSSSVVYELLDIVGLPEDYEWVVLSGSGRGYHVWFLGENLPLEHPFPSKKATSGIYSAKGVGFDHLELRYARCQTLLPPSIHPSGGRYQFLHDTPTHPPTFLDFEQIRDAFFEITYAEPVFAKKSLHPKKNVESDTPFKKIMNAIDPLVVFNDLGWNYGDDGQNYIGECPRHDSVSGTCLRWHKEQQFFYCFHDGCEAHGDLISFISLFLAIKPYQSALWAVQRYAPELTASIQREQIPHPAEQY